MKPHTDEHVGFRFGRVHTGMLLRARRTMTCETNQSALG